MVGLTACHGADAGTVEITVEAASPAGIAVYFQDAGSNLLGHTVTDATGKASGLMTPGGYVTAIEPLGHDDVRGTEVYTMAGVEPGDRLVIRADPSTLPTMASPRITFPTATDPAVTRYQVFAAGCQVGMLTPDITPTSIAVDLVLSGCDATVDLLVVGFDVDQVARTWAFAPDVAVTSAIALSGLDYRPYGTLSVTFSNVPESPPGPTSRGAVVSVSSPRGPLAGGNADARPGTTTIPLSVPEIPGASLEVETWLDSNMTSYQLIDAGPYAPALETDVGARLVPDATSCPVYLLATRTLTWTEAPGGTPPDAITAAMRVARYDGSAPWTWRIVGPYAGPALELPALPDELAPFQIDGRDFYAVQEVVRGVVAGGYAALRGSGVWTPRVSFDLPPPSLFALAPATWARTAGCPPI